MDVYCIQSLNEGEEKLEVEVGEGTLVISFTEEERLAQELVIATLMKWCNGNQQMETLKEVYKYVRVSCGKLSS